ncbi:hypothetical protein BD413DRAFT_492035 [Trametes elegans]|nr:hypothetical protein BD413DRAFT_492035 [Trametes elegans]
MSTQDKLPHDASSGFTAVNSFAKLTRLKPYDLISAELFWRERDSHLQKAGYCLRPRYAPKWAPSWTGKNAHRRSVMSTCILMDARPLYPGGYHPVRQNYSPDSLRRVTAFPRQGLFVIYYYVDIGLSIQIPEGASPFVIGDVGRDTKVPELSSEVPYDAFKVDIHSLGSVISTQFEQRYNSMEFLLPLLKPMKRIKPSSRPTAEEVLEQG